MNLHTETLTHRAKKIEEVKMKRIIEEDHAMLDSLRHHMIPTVLNIYT